MFRWEEEQNVPDIEMNAHPEEMVYLQSQIKQNICFDIGYKDAKSDHKMDNYNTIKSYLQMSTNATEMLLLVPLSADLGGLRQDRKYILTLMRGLIENKPGNIIL